jgi:hypothetical protein
MLVILFPVISATDDLRAMQNEMEESPASKRTIGQAGVDRVSASRSQTAPALVSNASSAIVSDQDWQQPPAVEFPVSAPHAMDRPARAPPSYLPA